MKNAAAQSTTANASVPTAVNLQAAGAASAQKRLPAAENTQPVPENREHPIEKRLKIWP